MFSEIIKFEEAIKRNIISKDLRKTVKILIEYNIEFKLIYNNSREKYFRVEVAKLNKQQSKNLLINGHKKIFLKLCQN